MDTLNLGTGNKPIEGAINHDLRLDPKRPWVTVAHDLNELPWPWKDNSFDLVVACAVLEHLRINLMESVGECWRILRPGAILYLKLPWWKGENSWMDPTHYWKFSTQTLDFFDPDTKLGRDYAFYDRDRKWKIVQKAKLNNSRTSFAAKLRVRKA